MSVGKLVDIFLVGAGIWMMGSNGYEMIEGRDSSAEQVQQRYSKNLSIEDAAKVKNEAQTSDMRGGLAGMLIACGGAQSLLRRAEKARAAQPN